MSIMKKLALAAAAVAFVATSSFSGQVLTGGNIPLINNIVGIGVITLDLSSTGSDVNVATFIVNNNAPNYSVSWTLENGGYFMSGTRSIAMSDIKVAVSASNIGTLGTGGVAPAATITSSGAAGTPTGAATWAVTQTTATENYMVAMSSDWTSASSSLAGLYTEQIVFTITATL